MTPLVANQLVGWLEGPRHVSDCDQHAPGLLVVLAGGVDRRPLDAFDFSALSAIGQRRVDRGITQWRRDPRQVLVFSGGPAGRSALANADLMAAYARWHRVPDAAIRTESRSSTTWENAFNVAGMVHGEPIRLVTSAMHMPRAQVAFRAAGLRPCPMPTDFRRTPVHFPSALVPRASSLVKTQAALHELAGLLVYRLRAERLKVSGNLEADRGG